MRLERVKRKIERILNVRKGQEKVEEKGKTYERKFKRMEGKLGREI